MFANNLDSTLENNNYSNLDILTMCTVLPMKEMYTFLTIRTNFIMMTILTILIILTMLRKYLKHYFLNLYMVSRDASASENECSAGTIYLYNRRLN